MDTVPIRFCEDVFNTLQWYECNFRAAARELPEPWKAVAKRLGAKRRTFKIAFCMAHGKWSCWMEGGPLVSFEPQSLEELLAVNRRYLGCSEIVVSEEEYLMMYNKICSRKEDITDRLIPFLNTIPQNTNLRFCCSKETTQAYLEIFRNLRIFYYIDLPYCGRESEDFLAVQITNSPRFKACRFLGPWPNTETVEKLVIRFLESGMDPCFCIKPPDDPEERESSLKVTLPIMKAAFNLWYDLGSNRIAVDGPQGPTMEELLSLPVPGDLWRVEDSCSWAEGSASIVRWSKPDGSCFTCEFLENSRYLRIRGEKKKNCQPSVEEGALRSVPEDAKGGSESDSDWFFDTEYKGSRASSSMS
uniref:Tudor domain-containing protein n=1 Tax=Steinernema glaseri TaxID=37863 RepID=A0A1I7ZS10_9BILA